MLEKFDVTTEAGPPGYPDRYDVGYAAGVAKTEAKYAKLVMAAIAHRHPAGHCPVPSLWPEDCSLDEALRQVGEVKL